MADQCETDCTSAEKRAAWFVHAVTAAGVLCGVFSLTAIADGNAKVALLWMMLALVVDGVDGAAARKVDVQRVTPDVDGHQLDLLIDFVTCCVAPAAFLYRFGQLSQPLAVLGVTAVMLSSLFWMARHDQEAEDQYFNGFPAMWNLVVTVFFVLNTTHVVNLTVVLLLSALSFTNVKFVHPVRVRELREITLPIMALWVITMTYLVLAPESPFDEACRWFQIVAVVHQVFLTIRRTWFVDEDEPVTIRVR